MVGRSTRSLFNSAPILREGQDSNLRSTLKADNRLAGGPIRPLWHPPVVMLKHCKGGGSGIRTHGNAVRYVGFQDQCLKPLGHPSIGYFGQVRDSVA